jgi:hypothetical protein
MKKVKILIVLLFFVVIGSTTSGQMDKKMSNLVVNPDGCVSWDKFKPYGTTDVRCWDCTIVAGLAYGEPCTGPQNQ